MMEATTSTAVIPSDDELEVLFMAAMKGDIQALTPLLDKYGPAILDLKHNANDSVTTLMYAIHRGHEKMALFLLEKGVNIHAQDSAGWTALSYAAAAKGQIETVACLLKKGAKIDAKNISGVTPLMHAAAGAQDDIVRLLLEKGANAHEADDDGKTVQIHAQRHPTTAAIIDQWVEEQQKQKKAEARTKAMAVFKEGLPKDTRTRKLRFKIPKPRK